MRPLLTALILSSLTVLAGAAPPPGAAVPGSDPKVYSLIARDGKNYVRIETAACTNDAVKVWVNPRWHADLRRGNATLEGVAYELCWLSDNGFVYAFYADGDAAKLPVTLFLPEAKL